MEIRSSVVLLLGPPASGKTTLGGKLARRNGYSLFDVGTHMRQHMPPHADADSFAMNAVGEVLAKESKVILSGYPKWSSGLDHLKSCRASIDMAIILQTRDASELSRRAAERHRTGERPEDDQSNFDMRLKTYEENAGRLGYELGRLHVQKCYVNPMDAPGIVEQAAQTHWSILMPKGLAAAAGSASSPPRAAASSTCSTSSPKFPEFTRGRSAVPGSSDGARERRDPSEADIEVSLCLLSGEELLRPLVPVRTSTAKFLKSALIDAGETTVDLDLFYEGQLLCDTDLISGVNGFYSGAVINVVRKEKPPPPPRQREPSEDSRSYYRCFTPDSVVRVLQGDVEVQRSFKHVKVGDMVRTGPGQGIGFFRRVQRVWKHSPQPSDGPLPAYELADGCRITVGHPALINGKWCRPESIRKDIASLERGDVYQLEIEGHVDTVLVGSSNGVVCALLGRYCGPEFGWNVFTRKTVQCDQKPCKKCFKACIPGLTFDHSKITEQIFAARYEPY